jgi:hypothetical protein
MKGEMYELPLFRERKDGLLPCVRAQEARRGIIRGRGFLFLGRVQRLLFSFPPLLPSIREVEGTDKFFTLGFQDFPVRVQKSDQRYTVLPPLLLPKVIVIERANA